MSRDLIPAEEVWSALEDAISIAREFDGAAITEKLARFGLDTEIVREVVTERWSSAQAEGCTDPVGFARAFAEGLITGSMLAVRA